MTDLAAIDPGKRECAVARAEDSELTSVRNIPSFTHPRLCANDRAFLAGRAVYEIPDRQNAPFEDLVWMLAAGAQLAAWLAPDVKAYRPAEWKGQTPKPIHHDRLWSQLSKAERRLLGGAATFAAIDKACERGARERWRKSGKLYYRDAEFPRVSGMKMTHDKLDAAALALFDLGRLER